MTPTQIRQAYGFSNVSFGSQAANGTGTTIAIVDAYDDPNIASDLTAFDSYFGLPNPTFTKVNETGGTSYPAADSPAGSPRSPWTWNGRMPSPRAPTSCWSRPTATRTAICTRRSIMPATRAGVVAVSMSWGGGE